MALYRPLVLPLLLDSAPRFLPPSIFNLLQFQLGPKAALLAPYPFVLASVLAFTSALQKWKARKPVARFVSHIRTSSCLAFLSSHFVSWSFKSASLGSLTRSCWA